MKPSIKFAIRRSEGLTDFGHVGDLATQNEKKCQQNICLQEPLHL